MKAGDLVTLSQYAQRLGDLYKWSDYHRKIMDRPPLVGIVVRVEDSSLDERRAKYINSQNDRFRYYINWMGTDYPASRWGNRSWLSDRESYFFRNDLKYVRSKK